MPELAFEAGKMNFTDEQNEQIAKEAREEILNPKKPEESAEESKDVSSDDGVSKEVEKKAEESASDDTNKTGGTDEGKSEKGQEEVKIEEKKPEDIETKRQALIKDYAEREKIPLEQATEEVAKNEAVIKKYGDDPIKLAAALRKAQSEFDRTRADLEKTKQQAQTPKLNDFASVRSYVDKAINAQKDKLVEMYREEYPGLSANLDDAAVVDLMRKEATEKMMVRVEENRLNMVRAANDKRQKLLENFADGDKEFLSEVKGVLDKTSDNVVLDEVYGVEHILRWARGDKNRIEKLVKDAEERGYKRGKEEPKIISQKLPVTNNSKVAATDSKPVYANKLTAAQRESAESKFESMNMSKEEMYKFYHETYLEQPKAAKKG